MVEIRRRPGDQVNSLRGQFIASDFSHDLPSDGKCRGEEQLARIEGGCSSRDPASELLKYLQT
jgi:hypothetical protein